MPAYTQQLDAEMRDGGGEQEGGWYVFGNDDGYLFGPPDIVFPALERFAGRILARRSLRLQRAKTEVFCWGELPAGTPADLKRAGMEVNGVFEPGMECYGIGIGSPVYVNAYLESIVEEIRGVADQTARTTGVFPQLDKTSCAWLMATPTLETYIPSTPYRTNYRIIPFLVTNVINYVIFENTMAIM